MSQQFISENHMATGAAEMKKFIADAAAGRVVDVLSIPNSYPARLVAKSQRRRAAAPGPKPRPRAA